VHIPLFGFQLHPHVVFELAGFVVGIQVYLFLRRREHTSAAKTERSLWMLVAAAAGGMAGAKILAVLENDPGSGREPGMWLLMLLGVGEGGRTIVGGILGGWLGIELAKWLLGIKGRTGDAAALALALAIAIGRVGCFLTGLDDKTYGVATALPWGVDFGDGVLRHPTQLYETLYLIVAGLIIQLLPSKREGDKFRWFIVAYFGFRFLVEFIKPTNKPIGLSAIQVACVVGVAVAAWQLWRARGAVGRSLEGGPAHG
jgi:prolipoprotein diacylglyceryltransferase